MVMNASWKIIFATSVIFAAGLVTGLFWSDSSKEPGPSTRREPIPRGPRMNDFIERFGERLQLTETQRTNITTLLTESQARMDAIMKEMRPKIEQEFSQVHANIKGHLTDEQATDFEEIIKTRRLEALAPAGQGWDAAPTVKVGPEEEMKAPTGVKVRDLGRPEDTASDVESPLPLKRLRSGPTPSTSDFPQRGGDPATSYQSL